MKAADFDYVRPGSAAAVLAALSATPRHPQLLAGGQSLLAMMNFRVASPDVLIDMSGIDGFRTATETVDHVVFGAGVTHSAIEDRRVPDPSCGLMPDVAANIAYRAVRNRGTIGGSLALADPAADWPVVMAGLGATLVLASPRGEREVAADAFATGTYETVLEADEMIARIVVPRMSPTARFGHHKFARKSGEFAHSIGLIVRDDRRDVARAYVGAAAGPPLYLARTSSELRNETHAIATFEDAVVEDLAASGRDFDSYSSGLHLATLSRAFAKMHEMTRGASA